MTRFALQFGSTQPGLAYQDRLSAYGICARGEAQAPAARGRHYSPPGARLLDVACGSGQLALIAAREGVQSTGVDFAPNWVDRARCRSKEQRLTADFREGDVEALPGRGQYGRHRMAGGSHLDR